MDRKIGTVLAANRVIDDGDMLLYRVLPLGGSEAIGPFVFFDHYQHEGLRGIGDTPHPHAGIELISYLLDGGMEHRDSMGFRDRLGAGDAQWIRAGSGILHAEQPLSARHGLQLWASLPAGQRFAAPAYAAWRAADLPRVDLSSGSVRVIAGEVAGVHGPIRLATPATLAHVRLEPGATVGVAVDPAAELGLYVMDGTLAGPADAPLLPGSLAMLTTGDRVVLTNLGAGPADVAIFGGTPAERPFLFAGPFVMGTREEVLRTKRAYATGDMGRLDGVPF